MKKIIAVFSLLTAFYAPLRAQCDGCSPIAGEVIDFCYTDPAMPGYCVQFTTEATWCYLDRGDPKKIAKITLPAPAPVVGLAYLNGLLADKKLKLKPAEVLLLEDAIFQWQHMEAIRTWNKDILFTGFTVRPSGLAYKVLQQGTGKMPATGKKVRVHYTGWLEDGTKFDSSLDNKRSFDFVIGANMVIKGWDEGVALFPVGSRVLMRLPPDLAYGTRGIPGVIPPNAVLYFEIQILSTE